VERFKESVVVRRMGELLGRRNFVKVGGWQRYKVLGRQVVRK